MNERKVVILGGGVAGMSAAHELVERGFSVEVYEKRSIPGGKARSIPFEGSGRDGRRDLPGEHGFRFFPRFYRHLPDTMKRIPVGQSGRTAFDNLVQTTRLEYPRFGHAPIVFADKFPTTLADWQLLFDDAFHLDLGFQPGEQRYFAERVWQILTSCEDRRLDEYEKVGWWDFVGASTRSLPYQHYLAVGLTRCLNAAQAKLASTKTIGDILVQLMLGIAAPGRSSDNLLNGPTNDVWIQPWLDYLQQRGVTYRMNASLERLNCDGTRIVSATLSSNGRTFDVEGDFYVAAVPLEVFAPLITRELLAADATLEGILRIRENTQWMNGIQFYLKEDVPLVYGHELYVDSPWALTSISQAQFWPDIDLSAFGDGTVRGILSVDVSEWSVPGSMRHTGGKPAAECSREEIAAEVWQQLKDALNYEGATKLSDEVLHSWFLDPDIQPDSSKHPKHRDLDMEPLLVNLVNSWQYRPDAYTRLPNLFLASDYVRTYTDLASMEGANEAARRAVNAIVDASGSNAGLCTLWKLHEPDVLALWRRDDETRYRKGLPWNGQVALPSGCRALRRRRDRG